MKQLWVIAYDIADDKRRSGVEAMLKGCAERVQESIFEGYFLREELRALHDGLRAKIETAEDSLRFYPVCAWCQRDVERQGSGGGAENLAYYIV